MAAKKRERKVEIQEPASMEPEAAVAEPSPEPAPVDEPEPSPATSPEAPASEIPAPAVEAPAPVPIPPRRNVYMNARMGMVHAGPLSFAPGDYRSLTDEEMAHPNVRRAIETGLLRKV